MYFYGGNTIESTPLLSNGASDFCKYKIDIQQNSFIFQNGLPMLSNLPDYDGEFDGKNLTLHEYIRNNTNNSKVLLLIDNDNMGELNLITDSILSDLSIKYANKGFSYLHINDSNFWESSYEYDIDAGIDFGAQRYITWGLLITEDYKIIGRNLVGKELEEAIANAIK